jgi:sarcosine oxidase subunit delta
MLDIPCPWCGPRAEIEFRYGGEAHLVRPAGDGTSEDEWSAYLYLRDNTRGEHAERWRHIHGCGQFFNVLRDTVSDRISASYPPGAERPAVGGNS